MGQSRWVIALVVWVLSFVLPAGLCLVVARVDASSIAALALLCVAAVVWLVLLVLVNWWEFTSIHLRIVWAVILGSLIALRVVATARLPLTAPLGWVEGGLAILALAGAWLTVTALAARRPEGAGVEFAFPLSHGRFLITDGGDGARSFLVNYHYGFGPHRTSGVGRSMRYAMDVVQIGTTGRSSRGFLPPHNEAFAIWEHPLHSPCDGVVVHAINDVPDNGAFGAHRPYGVGNHVVIRGAGDVYVVLGHMRIGSVMVAPGDRVRMGARVGAVGNSGWTERPHVHCQAMRTADGDWWHGEPVPMRFGGRFPVRNQVIRACDATSATGTAPRR